MTIRKKFTLTFPTYRDIPPIIGGITINLSTTRFSDYAKKSRDNKEVNYGWWRSCPLCHYCHVHEDTLTEINELNNFLTRDGFLLTMTDDDGNIHELGTNTFGLISTQSEDEIRELVAALTQSATGKDPEIIITTWEDWHSNRK